MAYPDSDIRSVLPPTQPYDPQRDPMNVAHRGNLQTAQNWNSLVKIDERLWTDGQKTIAHEPMAASNVHALNAPQARTQEQILAECQARYDEMASEAAKPERQFPCSTCRWRGWGYSVACEHPLITGIDGQAVDNWDFHLSVSARLCGPEKALWEPRKSWWARFVDWLVAWLAR